MTARRGLWLISLTLGALSTTCSPFGAERRTPRAGISPVWTRALRVQAQDLVQWQGLLAVLRRAGDPSRPLLSLHEASTGRRVGTFGREGLGPGEVIAPFGVTVDLVADRLWVLDLTRRRLIGFEFMDGAPRPSRVIQFSDPNTVLAAAWWHRSIVASGFYIQGQFAVFDSAGALERYVGPPLDVSRYAGFVFDTSGAVSSHDGRELAYHSNRARSAVTSDGVVVLARFLRPQLELYDLSGRHIRTTGTVAPAENDLLVVMDAFGRAHVSPTEDTRYEYLDLAIGSLHIYALYSGRSEHSHGPEGTWGSQLHVFSRQGDFERAVPIGTDLSAIEVDESRGVLYGIGPSARGEKSALHAFPLHQVFRWAETESAHPGRASVNRP